MLVMKRKEKHIQDIDQLLNKQLVNNYEPSFNFVDNVMLKVEELNVNKPVGKVLQIVFRMAAAVAVVFFLSNVFIMLSSMGNSSNQQTATDWTGIYEQKSSASWYDYYNDDLFLADN